ncbi:MAG: NACHT domain-containing protein, partial [Rivularia sp. (in: cyanobacteria)]
MPKYSYGEKIQNRVKRLLEALLDYVNYEFEQNLRIEYKWEPEDSNNLNITTTLRELLALTGKDKYDAKLTKPQIGEALKRYLKEYLGILLDNRTKTKGSDEWIFTLKLWGRDKETNLRKFDELWEEKRQGKSKELASKEQQKEDLWHEIFHHKIENQLEFIRHKATERGFEVNVHVPLGLVERKQQQRRDKHSSPNNPYELEKEVIVKTYEHDAFLKEVIGIQSTENKKHIGIIGEAGAGKTTLLSKVAEYLKNETEYLPVWISLASLQGETLENYLLDTWFSSIECSKTTEQLKQRFSQADIWLLLDGVDEMAENSPLDAFKIDKLPDWLRKARFVLTCRLNVWDERINNPLTGFETYKTQEFKPEQVDDFIQNWFQRAESIEKGRLLQTKLKESRHDKICSLVTNPLRLSLLCQTFYLDKQGELPETKAGLYERFTNYFYEWKPENIPQALRYSDDKKDELHKALSKLALAGIDSNGRFRLDRQFARKQMGEELFKLACDVGWLNLVDRDAKTDRELYAFFHANFQEYFAALAIDDWDYFLPREHDNKPVADKRYRIFEPQWKEVILLWLGRDEDDVSDVEKEEFIKTLVEFDDGCGDTNFYGFQTYFIAAAGIAEFKNCSKADKIVFQIVKWAFGYFNYKENRWQHFMPLNKKAYRLLQHTLHGKVIICLIQLLKIITDDKTYASVAAKNGSENAQIIILQISLTLLDFSSENLEAKKAIKAIVDNSNNLTDIAFNLKHLEFNLQIEALNNRGFFRNLRSDTQEKLLINHNHQQKSIQQDGINLEEEIPRLILSLDTTDEYLSRSETLKRLVTNNHEAVAPIVKFIYKLLSEKHKDIYLHLFDCLNFIARIVSNSQEIIDCL